jgi:iron(III) transport system permease protein
MRQRLTSRAVIFTAALVLVAAIVVYPMLIMLIRSVAGGGGFTLRHFAAVFQEAGNLQAMGNTLFVASAATFLSLLLGIGLAWLTSRTDMPGQRAVKILSVFPLFVPPFIYAIAWQQLLGPVGYVNKLYMAFTGGGEPLFQIYGAGGIILVMTAASFSTVYLIAEGAFSQLDYTLEEAAQTAGAGPGRVLKDITLPLMLPHLLAAGVMVFVTEISNFGVPAILGFQVSYHVLTTRIYQLLHEFYRPDNFEIAAAMSVILLAIAVIGLLVKDYALRRGSRATIPGKPAQPAKAALGMLKLPVCAAVLGLLLILVALPLAAVAATSLTRAYGLDPVWENLTLANYERITELSLVKRAFVNSLLLAVGAASAIVALGTVVAYLLVRTDWPGRQWLDIAVTTPYAIPGTVVALAMILAFSRPLPFLGVGLYNTLGIILVAYVARYLFFAVRTAGAAMTQVHASMEEAARMTGAGWGKSCRDILLPQIKNGLLAAWVLAFTHALRELTLSILLWSAGNETIAVAVFNLQEKGSPTSAAALAMVLIVMSLAGYLIVERLSAGGLQKAEQGRGKWG